MNYDSNNPFADDNDEQLPQVYNPFEATEPPNYAPTNNNDDDVVVDINENKKKNKKKKKKAETAYAAKFNEYDNNNDVWNTTTTTTTTTTYNNNNGALTESDVIVREQNMKRREAELIEREKKLDEMDKLARKQGLKPYNWPFKCWAITYHSIDDDILPVYRSLVKKIYFILLSTWLVLCWNMIVVFGRWFTKDVDGSGSQAIWSLVFVLLGVPGSWLLWYRRLYDGCIDDSTGKWGMFLIVFALHTGFCIVMAIGIPKTASAGLMYMVDLFVNYNSAGLGFLSLVATLLWTLVAIASAYMLTKSFAIWRDSGKQAEVEKNIEKTDATAKLLY